jgi:hypothetical protein
MPVAALCVLLAGCSAGRAVPPGLSPDEVQRLIDEQNALWWNEMFPGEPQPVVEPIDYVEPGSSYVQSQKCIIDANIQGVRAQEDGGLSFASDSTAAQDAFNRANYICTLSYPSDVSDPEALGYYSDEQLDYLDDYYRERLTPCLRLLGFEVPDRLAGGLGQSNFAMPPYWIMTPQPQTDAEWSMIDLRCPPPPIGPTGYGF